MQAESRPAILSASRSSLAAVRFFADGSRTGPVGAWQTKRPAPQWNRPSYRETTMMTATAAFRALAKTQKRQSSASYHARQHKRICEIDVAVGMGRLRDTNTQPKARRSAALASREMSSSMLITSVLRGQRLRSSRHTAVRGPLSPRRRFGVERVRVFRLVRRFSVASERKAGQPMAAARELVATGAQKCPNHLTTLGIGEMSARGRVAF